MKTAAIVGALFIGGACVVGVLTVVVRSAPSTEAPPLVAANVIETPVLATLPDILIPPPSPIMLRAFVRFEDGALVECLEFMTADELGLTADNTALASYVPPAALGLTPISVPCRAEYPRLPVHANGRSEVLLPTDAGGRERIIMMWWHFERPARTSTPTREERISDRFGSSCRVERECGALLGIDCGAAVDGAFYYVKSNTLEIVSSCGGMLGPYANCPPREWTCPR